MIQRLLLCIVSILSLHFASAQNSSSCRQKITSFLATRHATVGVYIEGLEDGDTLSVNGNAHFPMQSVFKFHIALAVLNEVDNGRLALHQKVFIKKSDLMPGSWSPIQQKYPAGNISLPLDTILAYTVSQSDNVGCDRLLRLLGGPLVVNNYLHKIGIADMAIVASEGDMRKAWDVQFTNWTTPAAASKLLKLLYTKKILSTGSRAFILKLLTETSTGPDRIKGQLPAETIVAHKTGTSGTNDQGITAAVNDMGIVTLPNGKHFAISVYVTDSKENDKDNAAIIAGVTKIAWDYFSNKST